MTAASNSGYSLQKRSLVTGGAGFIGSHLCRRLLERGHQVLCVDNFFTGSRANIAELLGNPNFELMRHDVTFPLYVEVDEIYNLACPASPVHYQFDPVQTTKTSVIGAVNMLGLAKRLRIPILQASTSEVYGDPTVHPQTEDYWGNVNTIGPRSCYDEGKRCAETLFFDYHRQHDLQIKVVRIFNTYGPFMHPNDGRVVSNFIVQALKGEPITLYGDGMQTRSFCYVDDLVTGLIAMMETDRSVTGPVNLGNPGEFTMIELAEMVRELVGSSVELVHRPLPQDDPRQRQPDILHHLPLPELDGGQVDRHHQVRPTGGPPGGGLTAGLLQHPAAHGDDEPALLGDLDEGARHDQPDARTLPADQGLDPHHPTGAQVELRLIVQDKLPALQGQPQGISGVQKARQFVVHPRLEEAVGLSPRALGLEEGGIGIAHQRFAMGPVLGIDRDPHGESGVDLMTGNLERLGQQTGEQALTEGGDGRHRLAGGQSRQDQHEFLGGQAAEAILGPQQPRHPTRHLPQQLIASGMAMGIVDIFEAVQVEIDHRQSLLLATGTGEGLFQPGQAQDPVGQAGQLVMEGQEFDARLGLLLFGDVVPHHMELLPVAAPDGGQEDPGGEGLAVDPQALPLELVGAVCQGQADMFGHPFGGGAAIGQDGG